MVNGRKVILEMFAILMVVCFFVGCSSSNIPSEDEIKAIIMTIEMGDFINNKAVSGLRFETFNITNGFVSKTPGGNGESSPYNIEVNYKINLTFTTNMVQENNRVIAQLNETIISIKKAIEDRLEELKQLRLAMNVDEQSYSEKSKSEQEHYKFDMKSRRDFFKSQEIEILESIEKKKTELINYKNRLDKINQSPPPDTIQKKIEGVGDNKRFSFVKKGDKWYGGQGWR